MRKPKEGIDYYGINELKEHKWMKNVNWDDILIKKIKAPFIPKKMIMIILIKNIMKVMIKLEMRLWKMRLY